MLVSCSHPHLFLYTYIPASAFIIGQAGLLFVNYLGSSRKTYKVPKYWIMNNDRLPRWKYKNMDGKLIMQFHWPCGSSSYPLDCIYRLIESTSVIGLTLNDTCLKEGSTVSLRCNVQGFPRPSVNFQRNDIDIVPESENYELEYYDQVIVNYLHNNIIYRIV